VSARIAVVGAGPAGLVTAIELARHGRAVTVIERAEAPAGPIAEQLSARGARALERLDPRLAATRFGAPSPITRSAWGSSELQVRDDLFGVWGPSCIVDRAALERALAEVARGCGVTLLRGERLQRVAQVAGGVRLTLATGHELEASFVVDATGRSASVARQLGAAPLACDSLVALQARLTPAAAPERAILVESTANGFWYSAPAADGSLAAVYFTDAQRLPRTAAGALWRSALAESRHTRERTRDCRACEAVFVRTARSQRLDRAAGDGWLAVGDAAMAWDPLSSSGLTHAILGASHAAAAAISDDRAQACEAYVDRVRREFAAYLVTRARIYGDVRAHTGSFWQRRQLPAALAAPIRLHPDALLTPGRSLPAPLLLAPGLTSATVLRALGRGARARELMGALRQSTGGACLGEELLGALQNLVALGIVTELHDPGSGRRGAA
jgi:flavin-dependent dehydrogenase